jgi:hypothetical protein
VRLGRIVHVCVQSLTVILSVLESDGERTFCNRLAISSAYKVVPVLKCRGVEVQLIIEATLTLPVMQIMPTDCPFTLNPFI